MLPNIIIATVGTSLLNNLRNLERVENPSAIQADLLRFTKNQKWTQVARVLRSLSADEYVCGAEINSLNSLVVRNMVKPLASCTLHFCISDTSEGVNVGEILRCYYRAYRVEIHHIEGLQDANPNKFRVIGLRQLARQIGLLVRQSGDPLYLAINATGGYKAQIAIAVLIGQTLGVQVYYKHERFNEIIEFPPMPIAFDYELIGQNAGLLSALEAGDLLELEESDIHQSLRVLLEETQSDNGKKLWALAPIGQIYLDGYHLKHPAEIALPPVATERRPPTFRDDHYPKSFREFVDKVWRENNYITGCHSVLYDRQNSICDREFYVRHDGQIIGEFKSDFGARFAINTTATSLAHKTAVVMALNEKYK